MCRQYFNSKCHTQYLDAEHTNPDTSHERRSSLRPPQLMCLGPNFTLHRNSAQPAGVVGIFDRVLSELTVNMNRMNIDKAELACLKAIILFNSGEFCNCSLRFDAKINRLAGPGQTFERCSASRKWTFAARRSTPAWTSTVASSMPATMGALRSCCCGCRRCARSVSSAWIICSSFAYSATRSWTHSWWRCWTRRCERVCCERERERVELAPNSVLFKLYGKQSTL